MLEIAEEWTVRLALWRCHASLLLSEGSIVIVNGGILQVFEYPDRTSADREASKISSNGYANGTNMANCVATPHFYKSGKLIVLHLVDD